MSDKSSIEWTDSTWNPIRGCSRVSEGCRNCYAEVVANRFKMPGLPYAGLITKGGQWNGSITVVDDLIDQPLRWKKPRRIFVNSMSDLFHENVPTETIDRIFAVMALSPQHTFQILTKRPARMHEYIRGAEMDIRDHVKYEPAAETMAWPLTNVWLGVSVEDQATADARIPLLLETPAAVRWISAEPLLCSINLYKCGAIYADYNREAAWSAGNIDWVVVGGESGPGARPMHPSWARGLRNQCQAAGTPFFFKQWGEWVDADNGPDDDAAYCGKIDCWAHFHGGLHTGEMGVDFFNCYPMHRVGKKTAGRLLDGREWNEYPIRQAQ